MLNELDGLLKMFIVFIIRTCPFLSCVSLKFYTWSGANPAAGCSQATSLLTKASALIN